MPETQGADTLPGILASIVSTKRAELDALRPRRAELEAAAATAEVPRDWATAVRGTARVSVIAECKRRSPGAGPIRPAADPADLARTYERGGAAAMSVLTDRTYFGGSEADLGAARDAARLPVLRKDFTLDPLHLVEARAAGADAVLLIVRILDDPTLRTLLAEATGLGMAALVETHDLAEIRRALDAGAAVIGINNRDLAHFGSDLGTTAELIEHVPPEVTVVSESGIRSPEDVRRLGQAGVHAVLVGEAILTAPEVEAAVAGLAACEREERTRV